MSIYNMNLKQQDFFQASKDAQMTNFSQQQSLSHNYQQLDYFQPYYQNQSQEKFIISLKTISQQLIQLLYQIAKKHTLYLNIQQITNKIIDAYYYDEEYCHKIKSGLKKRVYDIVNILIAVNSISTKGRYYILNKDSKIFIDKLNSELTIKQINLHQKKIKQSQITKRKEILNNLVNQNSERFIQENKIIRFPFFITLSMRSSDLQYKKYNQKVFQIKSSDLIRIYGDIDSLVLLQKIKRIKQQE